MKKKIWLSVVALTLCLCIAFGSLFSAAAISIPDILAGLTGGNSDINISQVFSEWLKGEIENGGKESVIDKFVQHLKDQFNGVEPSDPDTNPDDYVVLDKGEASNIAELFNLTVNELKKGSPSFIKIQTASMDTKIATTLQGGLGPITGLVESLIGTKDIFAGVIDGTQGNNTADVHTKYPAGNDVINNIPLSGKNYVAALTADDIKDYTITIYKTGAYRMHIDLKDVEGSAAASGLAHVFDTTDKAYATVNLGTSSINLNVMFKYVNNYVECEVNRNGYITSYTTGMGITFLFQQEDGSYSSVMPFFGADFEKEGIIYKITTEYNSINFALRKMGDVDNDGKVNSSDARLALRIASQIEACSEENAKYADVTLDGKVTASDARAILRASAKLETLPTTTEALGIKEYVKSESVQNNIDDLLILIMAYQSAKDAEEQKKLQDYYDEKYNGKNNGSSQTEETTTKINSKGDIIDDVLEGIGGLVSGWLGK